MLNGIGIQCSVRQKNIRISPYKLRRVADIIRGKRVQVARSLLSALPHNGSVVLLKLVDGALANARNNHGAGGSSEFVVDKVLVNGGPVSKRFQPKGRGRIYQILKPTSHVYILLKEVV